MKNFKQLYIDVNTPTIVENIITNFLWHNISASETINKSCLTARENNYCNSSDLSVSVSVMLDRVILDYDNFMTFVAGRRKGLISPATENTADYIRVMWEQTDTPEKIFEYLKNNL